MRRIGDCGSLDEVREHIDAIDRQIVELLAERGGYVRQVMRFKKSADDVPAPRRVERVIANVRGLAEEHGADPELVAAVYRTLIQGLIAGEMKELNGDARHPGRHIVN